MTPTKATNHPIAPPAPTLSLAGARPENPFGAASAHLVGIGGCGMSAIAWAMLACGIEVSGSDIHLSTTCEKLRAAGARIEIGHDSANLGNTATLVVSSAIRPDNPELGAAREKGLPILHRSEALARFLAHRQTILVSGTHGKTTTSAMTAVALEAAGFDPWAFIGGSVEAFNGNTRIGGVEWAVAEADESDGSFEILPAGHLIVTNVECDHLDYWQTRENMEAGYRRVLENVAPGGIVLCCLDDPGSRRLAREANRRVLTYGLDPRAGDFSADRIELFPGCAQFDLYRGTWFVGRFEVGAPGRHNVSNAVAALAMTMAIGGDPNRAAQALARFHGAGRRFDVKGQAGGITVIDDYAHHPTEIRATIDAARAMREESAGRLIVAFQPHRYTRTLAFMDEFAAAFDEADLLFLTSVYSAGEKPLSGATIDQLLLRVAERRTVPAALVENRKDLAAVLRPQLLPGDIVLMLGAGDITHSAAELAAQLPYPATEKVTDHAAE